MSRWQTLRSSTWWKRLTNKYTLVTLFQWELDARLRALEDGIEFYQRELEETQRQLDELASDPDKLEKFARETYWMHKPGERVALVAPESETDD
jgi:cell division protein FtsB